MENMIFYSEFMAKFTDIRRIYIKKRLRNSITATNANLQSLNSVRVAPFPLPAVGVSGTVLSHVGFPSERGLRETTRHPEPSRLGMAPRVMPTSEKDPRNPTHPRSETTRSPIGS